MPAAAESATCPKCGRLLNSRMRRESDRVRTDWECPVCEGGDEGTEGPGTPAPSSPNGEEA
jgi:hypothetical protein